MCFILIQSGFGSPLASPTGFRTVRFSGIPEFHPASDEIGRGVLFGAVKGCRVFKSHVNAFCLIGKGRAAFLRAIADSEHVIEGLVLEFIYVPRAVIRDINSKFAHDGNRFRPHTSRSCASAFNFKAISRIMPKQPFGHLAAS